MRNILLASALTAYVTIPAVAADIPIMAPDVGPPPIAVPDWSGCYIGGNGGAAWGQIDVVRRIDSTGAIAADDFGGVEDTGWAAGGQVGCDFQHGVFVFGIQGMFDSTGVKTNHSVPLDFDDGFEFSYHTDMEWLATLTGRVGVTFDPAFLAYMKGGAAWKREDIAVRGVTAGGDPFLSETAKNVKFDGWTVGGGIEYLWSPNLSVFVEANHAWFDERVKFVAAPGTVGIGETMDQEQSVTTVLAGVNLRLNFGSLLTAGH